MTYINYLKEQTIWKKQQDSPEIALKGKEIADKLKIIYNGFWKELNEFTFTDPESKTTFTARDLTHAKEKLIEKRKEKEFYKN